MAYMRFQPGQSRYFGSTPRPVSPITNQILPFSNQGNKGGYLPRAPKAPKASSFAIGKKERTEITKNLLRTPHFVPHAATRGLKDFAKKVLAHKENYSKSEKVFAERTMHTQSAIRDKTQQKKYIEGEVEALTEIKEPHIKDPYTFSHRSREVAGKTLRTVIKETRKNTNGQSVAERRAHALHESPEADTGGENPVTTPSWTAPTPLNESGEEKNESTDGTGVFEPISGGRVSAAKIHDQASINSSAPPQKTAPVVIISGQVTEAQARQWQQELSIPLIRLRPQSAGLVKSLSQAPCLIVVDGAGTPNLEPVLTEVYAQPTVVFAVDGQNTVAEHWVRRGVRIVTGKPVNAEEIKNVLTQGGISAQTETAVRTGENIPKTAELPDTSHVDEGLPF